MKFQEVENLLDKTKQELAHSRNEHNNEKNNRIECERTIEKLGSNIRDQEKELRNAGNDIENLKLLNNKLNEEKNVKQAEIERLKSHILVVTEQN